MFQALKNIHAVLTAAGLVLCLALSSLPAHAGDYLIGSQDVLKITVFEHPDLSIEARVSEEGKITFPLVGEVMIKNLTTRQVEQSIASKLSTGKIIKKPQVSVFVSQYKGRKVTIIGEVVKPGQYEIPGPTSLLDTISLALGLNQNAGYELTVFRKEQAANGKEVTRKIAVDIDRLLNGGDLKQDVELKNGDVIYVPKAVFYVYGEVNRPGAYRMERGITVKRAIALAGGLTPKGSLKRMEITRKQGEKDKTAGAGIDDQVAIDDVVRIKESIF
ncbi:SLBB domain-containing protein [Geomonas sp. RF6]|uniref:polysaccharide biosynthesis/export family protein n=1 Tax=Geomonas sp. RF6 TaxID=2897342 RepID=UPI001E59E774|nr:SLBB domain-containing protein [Geomonas sp. RF6]UFS68830.1 SLBB domain-containing protein [Geomonas sp. RF6]